MKRTGSFGALHDDEVIAETKRLALVERDATADLIVALAEMDARRLYLGQGFRSLFAYCTNVLLMSEGAAYGRIEAARVVRRCPLVLDALRSGSVTLTAVGLLAPHLTTENEEQILARVHRKSKREVEMVVADLRPRPDVPATIRKLPTRGSGESTAVNPLPEMLHSAKAVERPAQRELVTNNPSTAQSQLPVKPPAFVPPSHRPVVAPLAPERFKIQFTVSRECHDRLRAAQALMRHSVPTGDVAVIFERALALLVVHLEKQKAALVASPRAASRLSRASRKIPATVRRAVWRRDEARWIWRLREPDLARPADGLAADPARERDAPVRGAASSRTRCGSDGGRSDGPAGDPERARAPGSRSRGDGPHTAAGLDACLRTRRRRAEAPRAPRCRCWRPLPVLRDGSGTWRKSASAIDIGTIQTGVT